MFFEIYEKIKLFKGYSKTTRQRLVVQFVDILPNEKVKAILKSNPYVTNPFQIENYEFASILEFNYDDKACILQFGNYTQSDIKKFDLSPFKTDYNLDLIGNVGYMCQLTLDIEGKTASFSKLKSLIADSEIIINQYKTIE